MIAEAAWLYRDCPQDFAIARTHARKLFINSPFAAWVEGHNLRT